ncbi:MAG: Transcriptional regulator, MarR family [Acetothermia bacterium 64_32]|nr:MAG: Transcriptional regulator, MarR family [Acetothermia bacterium 64_32]HAF71191.1 MarR family transcriptional regulator [Candidatus Acetothermia bacterium]
MLKDYGVEISPAQGRVMFALWQEDRVPIHELARKTSLKKSTLTNLLDRLEEAGYLRRVRSQDDRREVLVVRWQDTYVRVSEEMTRLFYAGFSEQEIDQFEGYLGRILANLAAVERGFGESATTSGRKTDAKQGGQ